MVDKVVKLVSFQRKGGCLIDQARLGEMLHPFSILILILIIITGYYLHAGVEKKWIGKYKPSPCDQRSG